MRVYKVKIVKCSLSIMWYANHIGEEFDCELMSSSDRLFNYFINSAVAFKSLKPVVINLKNKEHIQRVSMPNGLEKYIYIGKESTEKIEVNGWILEDDVEILEIKE